MRQPKQFGGHGRAFLGTRGIGLRYLIQGTHIGMNLCDVVDRAVRRVQHDFAEFRDFLRLQLDFAKGVQNLVT